jgi:hypothetical protein
MGLNKLYVSGTRNLMELSPLVVSRKMLLINVYIFKGQWEQIYFSCVLCG